MSNARRQGRLAFSTALIAALILGGTPAVSRAQNANLGLSNDLVSAFQQVILLAQMSQTDPSVQGDLNLAVQNFQQMLLQAQPQQQQAAQPAGQAGFGQNGVGFGAGLGNFGGQLQSSGQSFGFGGGSGTQGISGSGFGFTGGSVGMLQSGGFGQRSRRQHNRQQDSSTTDSTSSDGSAHVGCQAGAQASVQTSDGSTTVKASARSGGGFSDGLQASASAFVKITESNGQIVARAVARDGSATASAKVVYDLPGSTTTTGTTTGTTASSKTGDLGTGKTSTPLNHNYVVGRVFGGRKESNTGSSTTTGTTTANSTTTGTTSGQTGTSQLGKGMGKVTSFGGQIGCKNKQTGTAQTASTNTTGTTSSTTPTTAGTTTTATPATSVTAKTNTAYRIPSQFPLTSTAGAHQTSAIQMVNHKSQLGTTTGHGSTGTTGVAKLTTNNQHGTSTNSSAHPSSSIQTVSHKSQAANAGNQVNAQAGTLGTTPRRASMPANNGQIGQQVGRHVAQNNRSGRR